MSKKKTEQVTCPICQTVNLARLGFSTQCLTCSKCSAGLHVHADDEGKFHVSAYTEFQTVGRDGPSTWVQVYPMPNDEPGEVLPLQDKTSFYVKEGDEEKTFPGYVSVERFKDVLILL